MVVEVPHSESLHLQPCLQETLRAARGGWAARPGGQDGTGANGATLILDPGGGGHVVSGAALSLQNSGRRKPRSKG